MADWEIGSEAWLRDRIEHGLDPGEGDQPDDDHLFRPDFAFAVPPDGLGQPPDPLAL